MANLGNINLDGVDPNQAFDVLPPAWYAMRVVASEIKPTKNGDGQYLQLELEIDENHHPELKGRKVWDRLNLWNTNGQATEIAQRTLKALVVACGKASIIDSEELHGISFEAKVTVRAATGQYEASNDVRGYRALSGGSSAAVSPAAAAGKPASAPKQASKASSAPPWAKK